MEDKQQLYNKEFKVKKGEGDITELILDFDKETKEPLVEVDKALVKKI